MLVCAILLLIAGWSVLVLLRIKQLFGARSFADKENFRLVVLTGEQDIAVEGFLRKLMARRDELWPRLEVAVLDSSYAPGLTSNIISLLADQMDFSIIRTGGEGSLNRVKAPESGDKRNILYYYDTRFLTGRDLLNAPIFNLLEAILT